MQYLMMLYLDETAYPKMGKAEQESRTVADPAVRQFLEARRAVLLTSAPGVGRRGRSA